MKGLISVSKADLVIMLRNCCDEIKVCYDRNKKRVAESFVNAEVERTTVRKWYRFFILPSPRFDFNLDSVMRYADGLDYPMFQYNPFYTLELSVEKSVDWVTDLLTIAESSYAGEPILLDIPVFQRISNPAKFYWTTTSINTSHDNEAFCGQGYRYP